MRARSALRGFYRPALLALLLGSTSCSVLLDFDSLQKGGAGASGGTSGSGGAGGGSQQGGSGGANTVCAGGCDDGDPCTTDSCDTSSSPAVCKHDPSALILDGLSDSLQADDFHRVTMTTFGDAFVLSVFETTAGVPSLSLYRAGTASSDSQLQAVADVSSLRLNAEPTSAAGLVTDALGSALHAYAGVKELAGARSRVHHLVFNGLLQMSSAETIPPGLVGPTTPTYDDSSPERFPIAWRVGGKVYGAWIDSDGAITGHTPGGNTMSFGDSTSGKQASTLAPLGSGQGTAGVAWTGLTSGIYTQLAGQGIGTLSECVGMNGFYLSSSSAAVVPGFWFLTWTKAGTGYLDSETHQVLCDDTSAPGCVSASACANDNISPGVRNSVSQLMQRASEPPDWSVFATAAPYLVPEGGNVTAVLLLSVGHHTTSGDTKTDIQLASMGTLGPLFQGPDLPALSLYAPLDKLAVAWIQPRSGGGEELVVQRYQMCF